MTRQTSLQVSFGGHEWFAWYDHSPAEPQVGAGETLEVWKVGDVCENCVKMSQEYVEALTKSDEFNEACMEVLKANNYNDKGDRAEHENDEARERKLNPLDVWRRK